MKTVIQRFLRNRGYLLHKYPASDYSTLPLFDLCVRYLMSKQGDQIKFVQVGANDGITGDPITSYIQNFPWTGVLVEPQPDVFQRLQNNYATIENRLTFLNQCVSPGGEPLSLFRPREAIPGMDHTFVVSSNPEVVSRQLKIPVNELESIEVPGTTLDRILVEHSLEDLDLLQIDTEGFDWEVLRTLDLTKFRPKVIQFEHGHLPTRAIDEAIGFLEHNGYQTHFGGYEMDTIAIVPDLIA